MPAGHDSNTHGISAILFLFSVIVHASNPPAFLFATSNGGKVSDFSTVMDSVILSAAAPMFSAAACEGVFKLEGSAAVSGFFLGAMDKDDDDDDDD